VENSSIKVNDDELDKIIKGALHEIVDSLVISEKVKQRIDIELGNRYDNTSKCE